MPDSTPGGTTPDGTPGDSTAGDGTSGDGTSGDGTSGDSTSGDSTSGGGALLGRSGDGRGRAGRMRTDRVRAVALLAVAVLQIVAGALGGTGAWGEPVGTVADAYPHPLLPAGTAFSLWSVIYVAVLALAVRQVLPSQRGREVHRRTGWWLVGAGVCNVAWVALFGQRWVLPAQVVIVALLGCLVAAWVAASRVLARDRWDRLLLHGPVALYTGWVAVATVVGAVTTAVALGAAVSV
ncbi:tryptophan-rich sensory protein, partial [Saccharomonospora halophila]|uniref:tryptophan-rich sensory protein n=1 Tax=Saccharomonospora halophila TaxID=129922 RepID=UPI000369E2CA